MAEKMSKRAAKVAARVAPPAVEPEADEREDDSYADFWKGLEACGKVLERCVSDILAVVEYVKNAGGEAAALERLAKSSLQRQELKAMRAELDRLKSELKQAMRVERAR